MLPRSYAHPLKDPVRFADPTAALAWMKGYLPHLLPVQRAAADAGWHDTAWQLPDAFRPVFHCTHPYGVWQEAHTLGLSAAKAAGNNKAVRQMLNSGGVGLNASGDPAQALTWYEISLDAALADEDPHDQGHALLGMAASHLGLNDPRLARAWVGRATEVWQSCGYQRGVALAIALGGEISIATGDHGVAMDALAQAMEGFADLDDEFHGARACALRGLALSLAGDHEAARDHLQAAQYHFAELGATRWHAWVLALLARASDGDDATAARAYAAESADLYDQVDAGQAEKLRSWGVAR
jgi:tetratricopeptide (TPR) repeat protein